MRDISFGQYYFGESVIHKLDPRVKLLWTVVFLFSVFFVSGFLWYAFLTVGLLVIFLITKIPLRLFMKVLQKISFFLLFTSLFCLFTTDGKVLFEAGVFHITWEGVQRGCALLWRLILAVAGSSLLTFSTMPGDLSDGLAKAMRPLKRIRIPVDDIAVMISISIRFIPILTEEADRIRQAQMARGMDPNEGNLIIRAKKLTAIFVPLFVSSIRRALDLALALEARCYQGGDRRTRMHPLCYQKKDYVAYLILIFYVGLSVALRLLCG